MSAKKRNTVRIVNAIAGAGYTSAKKAIEYIKQGRAVPAGPNAIAFVTSDHRHRSALSTFIDTDAAAAAGEGRASYDAIAGLPVVGHDAVQRFTVKRKTPKRTKLQAKAASKVRMFGPRRRAA